MGFIRLGISMDEAFAKKLDERVEHFRINRSEYLRMLVINDLKSSGVLNERK